MALTEHELRILCYLEQRGDTHRWRLVADLASPESRIGRGIFNGSNSAIPLIAGKWVMRLKKEGLVIDLKPDRWHRYQAYRITPKGSKMIRAQDDKAP